jgi:DNA polymerase I
VGRLNRNFGKTTDPERRTELEGRSSAIKWILVSCFGYQGFSNAKFGRIEYREAINAFAREILLEAKAILEANGWQIVHGIVDSLWITPRSDTGHTPIEKLCPLVTDAVDIRLEHEAAYDWITFVPQRNSDAGALTKYFGRADEGEFKYHGIECRQRSTPAFVQETQQELIVTLDPDLLTPAFVDDEVENYEDLIVEKSGMEPDRVAEFIKLQFQYIEVVPADDFYPAIENADEAIGDTDPDDVLYLACALASNAAI